MSAAILTLPVKPRRGRRSKNPLAAQVSAMTGLSEDRLAHAGISFEAQVLSYHVRDMGVQLDKLRKLIDDTFPA